MLDEILEMLNVPLYQYKCPDCKMTYWKNHRHCLNFQGHPDKNWPKLIKIEVGKPTYDT